MFYQILHPSPKSLTVLMTLINYDLLKVAQLL